MTISWIRHAVCLAGLGLCPGVVQAQRAGKAPHAKHAVPVVVLSPTGGPLLTQLKREVDSATIHDRLVLVDVGAPWCKPCLQFEQTLSDSLMIAALASARLVHLDFDTWKSELIKNGYIASYDLPELFLLTSTGDRGASFAHAIWYDYADSLRNAGVPITHDAEFMAPPMRAFLDSVKRERTHRTAHE